MTRTVRVAAAQYPIHELTSFAAYEAKLEHWVREAAQNGAQLLVFPEYSAMELARIAGRNSSYDVQASIIALQYYLADYRSINAAMAVNYQVFILSGSAPVTLTNGTVVNRARLFAPNGQTGFQEKDMMTRFEREEWGISSSRGVCVFDLGFAKIGIAICYDVEFPLIARSLAQSGADILLVPSCTDTLAGYHRVHTACLARALENQMFVVQSVTIGQAPWLTALDVSIGSAGFYAPSDRSFPEDGIIAKGERNKPCWIYADLNLDLLYQVRTNGDVLNAKDWDLQPGVSPLPKAKVINLANIV